MAALAPFLFQNLRGTRQVELEETFPSHVVCSWIGNSEQIVRKHHLQVTNQHFEKTVKSGRDSNIPNQPLVNGTLQNALQQSAATARKGLQADLVPIAEPVSMQVVATQYGDLQNDRVGDTGLEPVTPSLSS